MGFFCSYNSRISVMLLAYSCLSTCYFCFQWQYGVHGGRCGVCGDMWTGSQDNDDNGKFATGIIVRSYIDGHYINVTFEVSRQEKYHITL